jgi:hypothetical protein
MKAPRIIDLGTRWRSVVSVKPRSLYLQGKNPLYPLDRRLGGPPSRSGRGGKEQNSDPLPGLELPIIQAVAQRYTTDLSCLLMRNVDIEGIWNKKSWAFPRFCRMKITSW